MTKSMKGLILGALFTSLAACSGGTNADGDSSSTASDLTIAGKLGSMTLQNKISAQNENGKFDLAYSDLELYIAVYSEPPQIKKADVASDGSFSISITGVQSAPITAAFRVKSDTSRVFNVKFVDSKSGLGGNNELDSYSLKGAVQLGTLNISSGKVTINVADIPSANNDTSATVAAGYDFGGTWTAAVYSLPTEAVQEGFFTAQDRNGAVPAEGWSCTNEPCVGIGDPISLVRIVGKEFTKDSSTCTSESSCPDSAGTIGSADRYGISIWGGDAEAGSGIATCGYKTGFTAASARYGAGIHISTAPTISGHTMTLADFTFDSLGASENTTNSDNQPWMVANAKSTRDIYDCGPQTKNGLNLHVCKATATVNGSAGTVVYYANEMSADSGCKEDGTNKPVRMTDWSLTPDSCDASVPVTGFAGFSRTTCHYVNKDPDSTGPLAAMTYSCTHGNGTYTDSSLTTEATNITQWDQPTALLATNADCDSLAYGGSDAKKLAVYKCYAEAYQNANVSGCVQKYRFNWGASDPAQFVMTEGRPRPDQNFLTDLINYSSDGKTFFVNNIETETVAISAGSNGSMEFCEIEESTKIIAKKITDTQQLFSIVSSGTLLDSGKTACVAAVNGADTWENGNLSHRVKEGMKMMFLLNK